MFNVSLKYRFSGVLMSAWCVMLIMLMVCVNPTKAYAETYDDYFSMDLDELLSLDVSVASKKSETQNEAPGIVSATSQQEIKLYGDRTLEQLMARQTSVYTQGSYLYPHNLASFRGDMPTHLDLHTLLLINGRPVRSSTYGGDNFPMYMTYPLEHVSGVEVIRGPGSALYGTNAFTGVVNLKSREIPEERQLSVAAMTGTEGYWSGTVSGGGQVGALGYVSDIRTSGQQGYHIMMKDDTGAYRDDFDTNKSVSTMNHFKIGNLTLDLFYTHLESYYMGLLPRWGISDYNRSVNILFGNLGYALELHERAKLELNLTANHRKTNFDRLVKNQVDLNSEDWIGEATLFLTPIDDLKIVLGASQENQRKIDGEHEDVVIDPLYNHEPKNAYAQADYRLNEIVKLIGGLQWNKAAYGTTDTITRVGVILTPAKKWGLKFLRGEAFRAPFALETTLNDPQLVGSKALKPETLVTYDTQLFYNDDKSTFSLTYFNTVLKNLIIRDLSVSPQSFKNGGQQDFQGVEFEAKHFLTEQWHVLGSYTYQASTRTSDLDQSTVPHNMFKFGSAYTWDWGSAAVFYSFYSQPPRLEATEVIYNPAPSHINLLSLNVRLDPSQFMEIPKGKATLVLRGENLLDEDIWKPDFSRGGNPNTLQMSGGATAYIGLEIKL